MTYLELMALVLNVNINKFSRNTKIQVIIDNKNGITVDECAKVSRITEDVIKLDDEFKNEYTLEVTSPGINRPLFLRMITKTILVAK